MTMAKKAKVTPKDASTNSLHGMIDVIIKTRAALVAQVQACAVAGIIHAALYGDVSPMNKLDQALGNSINRNSLRKFLTDKGMPFSWVPKKDNVPAHFGFRKPEAEALKTRIIEDKDAVDKELNSKDWSTAKIEAPFEGYDLNTKLRALINKTKKDLADVAKAAKVKADPAMLADMEAMFRKYNKDANVLH